MSSCWNRLYLVALLLSSFVSGSVVAQESTDVDAGITDVDAGVTDVDGGTSDMDGGSELYDGGQDTSSVPTQKVESGSMGFAGSAPANKAKGKRQGPRPKAAASDRDEGRLLMSAGAIQAGGQISLSFDRRMPKSNNATDLSEGGGVFTLSPQVGVFIVKGLELTAGMGFSAPFGDMYKADDLGDTYEKSFNFLTGARYLFNFNVLYLYAGVQLGGEWTFIDTLVGRTDQWGRPVLDDNGQPRPMREKETKKNFLIDFPIGVLLPINRHVAIDVGMRLDFIVSLDDVGVSYIRNPWGYLGVQGFFSLF